MNFELVCFDVDGTLIDDIQFIWQVLHDRIGSDPERAAFFKKAYFAGEITYAQWAESDVELWRERGATRAQLMAALAPLRLMPGARRTLRALKQAGVNMAIVSGSVNLAVEYLIPDYREYFCDVLLNRIYFTEDGLLAGIEPTPFDMEHKADGVVKIAADLGVPLERIVYVGDHFNDVAAARIAGFSIAFNSKSPELDAVCNVRIAEKDLSLILPYVFSTVPGSTRKR